VIVNNLTVEMAMTACHLSGQFPLATVYSRVRTARERGTYDVLRLREEQEIRRMVIEIEEDNGSQRDSIPNGSCRRRDPPPLFHL
jgi:hypothetical protein